ncbi:MAG: VWA domain-containing protein [Candidatus Koribacter versatilis]|nr:VWA domain-containing protein [Candidatus Koribacter versatilis]
MLRSLWVVLTSSLMLNLAVGPALVRAQEAPADIPPITIRANTRLVVIDVVVTDKKGQPITGLKPENFSLEESGKKQKIATFTPPGAGQSAQQTLPPGVLSNRPEYIKPAGVPTVLLLDATNSHFLDQSYGRSQMLKYVLGQAESGKPMAVMTLTDQLHVLQDFTTDPKILMNAIKNLRPQEQILQAGTSPGPSSISAELASFTDLAVGYVLERRTLITIQALRDLSRMLSGFSGRKNVVWLTADFPFDLIPTDRNVSDEELLADLPDVRQKSVGTIASGSLASQQRMLHGQEIKQAQADLASAGIAVYPVDMRGIMASGIDVSTTFALRELAAETGGKAYVNQNEIKDGIALAVADENASYSLGYYPENKKWDGKFRNIKIKVDRGDTENRYRKGYFAMDPTLDKNWKPEQEVAGALQVNGSATQVFFMAQAKPTDPGKIRVVFLVDAHT